MTTLAELGEHEVLRRLRRFCAATVGDDAALLRLEATQQLVVSTDVLVEAVHFSDRTLSPQDLGWRAAAVNLSDLAAMGASPLGITVGASLPGSTSWAWLEAVYSGLQSCLERYGGAILGGDLTSGAHRCLSITVLGSVAAGQALYRHRAQVGQQLVATGVHGAAQAGLALLLGEISTERPEAKGWRMAHQRPRPRFDAVSTLRSLYPRGRITDPVAAMDTSDGLADAVIQICQQSGVGARLLRSQLPVPPGLAAAVGQPQAEQWTLYGGEDFELVMGLPAAVAAVFCQQQPGSCIVGQIQAGHAVELADDLEGGPSLALDQNRGYRHFAAGAAGP